MAEYKNEDGLLVLEADLEGIVPAIPEQEVLAAMVREGDPTNPLNDESAKGGQMSNEWPLAAGQYFILEFLQEEVHICGSGFPAAISSFGAQTIAAGSRSHFHKPSH